MQTTLGKNRIGDALLAKVYFENLPAATRFIRTSEELLAFIVEEYIDDLEHPEVIALLDAIEKRDWGDDRFLSLTFEDGSISFEDVVCVDNIRPRLVSGLQEILWQCDSKGEAYDIARQALLDAGQPLSRHVIKQTT